LGLEFEADVKKLTLSRTVKAKAKAIKIWPRGTSRTRPGLEGYITAKTGLILSMSLSTLCLLVVRMRIDCVYRSPNSLIALDRYSDDVGVEQAFITAPQSSSTHGAIRSKARAIYSFQAQSNRLWS